MPPWWLILLLSFFGAASRTREALPLQSPEERALAKALYEMRRRGLRIDSLQGQIDYLRGNMDKRGAEIRRRLNAVLSRIKQLRASGQVYAPPDLIAELRAVERDQAEFEAAGKRFEAMVNEYVTLIDQGKGVMHGANPPSDT